MTTVDEFELPKACVMRVVKAAISINGKSNAISIKITIQFERITVKIKIKKDGNSE
jgi:hypothetical protein